MLFIKKWKRGIGKGTISGMNEYIIPSDLTFNGDRRIAWKENMEQAWSGSNSLRERSQSGLVLLFPESHARNQSFRK